MSNLGYREIHALDALSIKQLNDTLRTLWKKVMGGIEIRDLSGSVQTAIEQKADGEQITELQTQLVQQAGQIELKAERTQLSALGERVQTAETTLTLKADSAALTSKANDLQSQINAVPGKIELAVSNVKSIKDGSSFEMSKDRTKLITPELLIGVPELDGQGNPTEAILMQIDETGINAPVIESPTVAAKYAGPSVISVNPNAAQVSASSFRSLAGAAAALNGRVLPTDVTINISAGAAIYEDVVFHQIMGAGLTINFGGGSADGAQSSGATVYGAVLVNHCGAVTFQYGNIVNAQSTGTQRAALSVHKSALRLNGMRLTRSGEGWALRADGGSAVYDLSTQASRNALFVSATASASSAALYVGGGSIGLFYTLTGGDAGRRALRAEGGIVRIQSVRPAGSVSEAASLLSVTDSTDGGGSGSTPQPKTASFTANASGWYQSSWKSGDNQLRQGYTANGEITGGIWFDVGAIRSTLSGYTAVSATLTLHRVTGYGPSGPIDLTLHGLSNAGKSGSPARVANYGNIASIARDERKVIALPITAIQHLNNGTANALALYAADGAVQSGRTYSKNYGVLSGCTDGGNAPVLTITYQ